MKSAADIIDRQSSIAAERATDEAVWQEIANLMLPGRADFVGRREPGARRTNNLYDSTALTALDNLAGGLWGTITNSSNKWFEIRSTDDRAMRRQDVKLWCAAVGDKMLQALAANGQRFYAQAIASYRDICAFGSLSFHVEQPNPAERVLHFESKPLSRCYVAENSARKVDLMFEKFEYSARQAVDRWKDKVPDAIQKAAEKTPHQKFSFIYAVMPAAEWGRKLRRGDMTHAAIYVCVDTGDIIEEGGTYTFPFQFARWSIRNSSPYGDGPAVLALPDTNMVNAMSKTTIIGAQKAVDPPILAPDESGLKGQRTTPGQIIMGGIDAQGRRMYDPLHTGANVGLGLELEEQRRKAIRDAFYASLLLMAERPTMTATEWLGRQEERLRLMGPHIGLVQSEWLDPLLDTVFVLMSRASMPFWSRGQDGWLPLPPDAIFAGASDLKIEFVSPLARAQKATEAASLDRFAQSILPIAQHKPEVLDLIDGDEYTRTMAEGTGVPAKILLDPERVEQKRAERAKQMQLQQAASLAGPAADGAAALKSLAEAGQAGGGQPMAGAA